MAYNKFAMAYIDGGNLTWFKYKSYTAYKILTRPKTQSSDKLKPH